MATKTLEELMNAPVEELKDVPPVPAGVYILECVGFRDTERDGQDGTPWTIKEFSLAIKEASEVDEDELAEFSEEFDVTGTSVRRSFMFNMDDTSNHYNQVLAMKRFLSDHLGIEGDNVNEMAAAAVGAQCMGQVGPRPDKNDPERVYNNLDRTWAIS